MDLSSLDLTNISKIDDFSGTIPLFPLSTVVLFPNTLLPLHIFEPRYKQMFNDVINAERMIGMALLKPGWQSNYYGNPDIFQIVGMGKVVSSETLDDGKLNIVLYGLRRVKIKEIIEDTPYRLARVDIINNINENGEETHRVRIEELISRWNFFLDRKEKSHKINVNTNLPLDSLTDSLATLIYPNVFDRQKLLEEQNVQKRAEMIIKELETRIEVISITTKKRNKILEKRNLN